MDDPHRAPRPDRRRPRLLMDDLEIRTYREERLEQDAAEQELFALEEICREPHAVSLKDRDGYRALFGGMESPA